MQSIQKLEHYFDYTVPQLIETLTADKEPDWGVMNAALMLDHLSDALKLSMAEYAIPTESISEKADKFKAITLLSDRAIPKGFNNPILELLQKSTVVELDEAKQNLANNIQLFKELFGKQPSTFTTPHNMFGYLNYHEWIWFHYKHFSHHFAQFGLIPYIDRFELQ